MLLFVFTVTELLWNAAELTKVYKRDDVQGIDRYNEALEEQIRSVTDNDKDFYRISQTSSKQMQHKYINNSASYGNALAHDYAGIAVYNSCPDNLTQDYLDKAGYREEGGCVTIVNTSVLPLDSLLGVRYILSPYAIKGYTLEKEADPVTEMGIYRNPYELPMAFAADYDDVIGDYENPFEYINDIYSSINAGKRTEIYKPVNYEVHPDEIDTEYLLSGFDADALIYVNIPWEVYDHSLLDVNGVYKQYYTGWLSPNVFHVPVNGGQASVIYHHEGTVTESPAQFYQVDFDTLGSLTEKLRRKSAEINDMGENRIRLSVQGKTGEILFLTVPYHEGWSARCNGKPVAFEKIADAFIGIPLTLGENKIELDYHIPGLRLGFIGSLIGCLMLLAMYMTEKKGKN